jgi:hypothetical protein
MISPIILHPKQGEQANYPADSTSTQGFYIASVINSFPCATNPSSVIPLLWHILIMDIVSIACFRSGV